MDPVLSPHQQRMQPGGIGKTFLGRSVAAQDEATDERLIGEPRAGGPLLGSTGARGAVGRLCRAKDRIWVMATPAMQMTAPAASVGVRGSCRKTTPAATAKTVCSSAKGATRVIEHRAISQNHRPQPATAPNRTV